MGKLNDVLELWQPGKFFIDSFIIFMNLLLKRENLKPSRFVKRDAQVWLACILGGVFPILPKWIPPSLEHFRTYSDASWKLVHSPGVGMLIPAQLGRSPKVGAWEFPKGFLNSVDEKGAKCFRLVCIFESRRVGGLLGRKVDWVSRPSASLDEGS